MSVNKIMTLPNMEAEAMRLRAEGRCLVFTNGCFDLLHLGHVRYLQAARRLGGALLVALNGDASVRALKGPSRPVNVQEDRAEVLAALECVNYVTIFEEPRVSEVIRVVRPEIYVKGGDYTVETLDIGERSALESVGARIEILGLVPGKSTTGLIEKMGTDLRSSNLAKEEEK